MFLFAMVAAFVHHMLVDVCDLATADTNRSLLNSELDKAIRWKPVIAPKMEIASKSGVLSRPK
jgi:hypothetical protein